MHFYKVTFSLLRASLPVAAVLFGAFWGANWSRSPSFGDSSYRFDGPSFMAEQENSLAELEKDCPSESQGNPVYCANVARIRISWNNQSPESYSHLLSRSCHLGQETHCRMQKAIVEAAKSNSSVWMSGFNDVHVLTDHFKIKMLNENLSAFEWHTVGVEGAVFGKRAKWDLVCGGLEEIPETLVCATNGNRKTNTAIGRVAAYIEQGNQLRSIKSHSDDPLQRFWQGVDLQRADYDSASDLLRKMGVLHPFEEVLWGWLDAQNWRHFLTFNAYSVFSGVPSHEFLHAAYFSSPAYRDLSTNLVRYHPHPIEDVTAYVMRIFDTKDTFILVNEIQASLFQSSSPFQKKEHRELRSRILWQLENLYPSLRIHELFDSPW